MKISIKYKITAIILVIMGTAMILAGLYNNFFAEEYYIKTKQASIKSVYEKVKEISKTDAALEDESSIDVINDICEKLGVSMLVIDGQGRFIYQYGAEEVLRDRFGDIMFGQDRDQKEKPETIENTEEYILQSTVDKFSENTYYELNGVIDSGNYVMIRISVESLQESLAITSTFYLGLGIVIIVVTTIAIIITTHRYTKPILQLAHISKRMSELDFDAKYEGDRNDEIGVLGHSMNQMSDKLEDTISQLKMANLELQKDIEKKVEIDNMRREFISNVSHELKTPISLIQGYAEGLQDGIATSPEDMKYYCDVIIDEADKMGKLVKELLNLNQLESGNQQLNMERFNISQLIMDKLGSYKIKLDQEKIKVDFVYTPVYVWADSKQIEQVISNYLSNAFNHIDSKKYIKVEILKKDGIVRVSVFNTGANIPEDELDNIWGKFYKVDKARTRSYGGNGIGLSIVKAVMDRHNKDYGVRNLDNGVEFWFELDSEAIGERHDCNN